MLQTTDNRLLPAVHAEPDSNIGTVTPHERWGIFSRSSLDVRTQSPGDIQIQVNKPGIAVRVEIPKEFEPASRGTDNDTSFIKSDITNDYYYYSVVDESKYWSYAWRGNVSDAPCFKPSYTVPDDPNAPWCVEIWNVRNGTFLNFTAPKFVRFTGLHAPDAAGAYNFTFFVADHVNQLGLPDFIHAWNTSLVVPVSMRDNPSTILGSICDGDNLTIQPICPPILAKGIVYAKNLVTEQIARTFVNPEDGSFKLRGLGPGDYMVWASAGVFHGIAYSLSDPVLVNGLGYNSTRTMGQIQLRRAPLVCGTIDYQDQSGVAIEHSLSSLTFLKAAGFTALNITVEATDPRHTYRFLGVSADGKTDDFNITAGFGTKYVQSDFQDPYGTEYAGLPPPNYFGGASYQLKVWVYISGYLQTDPPLSVTIDRAPGPVEPPTCKNVGIKPQSIVVVPGGAILVTLQLTDGTKLETPHEAEEAVGVGTITNALFGGNIIANATDQNTGQVLGITVINGTARNGTTAYADSNTINFYIIGFSELYNRTWSGVWRAKDYGLPTGPYWLGLAIRGYTQAPSTRGTSVQAGQVTSMTVKMIRAGAVRGSVASYDNRPGTRALQAPIPWLFLNRPFPVRARVYFYTSQWRTVGYVEVFMVLGIPNGVEEETFSYLFAGRKPTLRDIWFFGEIPQHFDTADYNIKAFTLGYVQQAPVNGMAVLTTLTGMPTVYLLVGNEIDLTGPVVFDPGALLGQIPENDHVTATTDGLTQPANNDYSCISTRGALQGAINYNASLGDQILDLPVFGFGGLLVNKTINGQGHFYYVSPSGARWCDYGLDVGNYTALIPEFGFTKHFMQFPIAVNFADLFLEEGVVGSVIAMASIYGDVNGQVANWSDVPLSWVRVEATNGAIDRYVPTLDGFYDGVGALFLPAGTYNITISVAFYQAKNWTNYPILLNRYVDWNQPVEINPPPLCPVTALGCTDPPPAPSFTTGAITMVVWDAFPVAAAQPFNTRTVDSREPPSA